MSMVWPRVIASVRWPPARRRSYALFVGSSGILTDREILDTAKIRNRPTVKFYF